MTEAIDRGVLWDLDGTLVDSTEHHYAAWVETMAAEGRSITREEFLASFGQRNDVVLRGFFGPELAESESARIADEKEARYRALVRSPGIALLPGARALLEGLRRTGWRQAIASSAPRANVEACLQALGLAGHFEVTIAGEDVRHGKPAPDVFLRAAEELGLPAGRCLVIEDAPHGTEAARRAGMKAIGVCSSRAALAADRVISTLEELSEDALASLLEG